jgi:hypothetical protein
MHLYAHTPRYREIFHGNSASSKCFVLSFFAGTHSKRLSLPTACFVSRYESLQYAQWNVIYFLQEVAGQPPLSHLLTLWMAPR